MQQCHASCFSKNGISYINTSSEKHLCKFQNLVYEVFFFKKIDHSSSSHLTLIKWHFKFPKISGFISWSMNRYLLELFYHVSHYKACLLRVECRGMWLPLSVHGLPESISKPSSQFPTPRIQNMKLIKHRNHPTEILLTFLTLPC